eukprot:GHVS01060772.1.p1 GENE.GHVS01060772.1~~GHVS01060772.1.p1  ORF type:complete len:681 (+),score=17.00 GHVS01060772.1:383-2425(+)
MELNKSGNGHNTTKPPAVLPVIEFTDLTCRLPNPRASFFSSFVPGKPSHSPIPVLNGISGSVAPGETVAIIGSSASGKSAFLNALTGTFQGSCTGTIKSNGQVITNQDVRQMTSYMRQTATFLSDLSVYDTVRYEALLKLSNDMTYSQKMERVEQVIEATAISNCRRSSTSLGLGRTLSGGEVKRVMMANALVTSPRLFFLDEPTTGLDASRAASLVELICEIVEQQQLAVLCVAHQLSTQLLLNFQRLLIFCRGSLIYQGPTADAVHYFQSLGFEQPSNASLGEYLSGLGASESSADTLISCYKSNIRRLDSGCYYCYFPSKSTEQVSNSGIKPAKIAPLPSPVHASGEPGGLVPKRRAASLWEIGVTEYGKRPTSNTKKKVLAFLWAMLGGAWWYKMYWLFRRRLQQAFRRSITFRRTVAVSILTLLAGLVFFQLFSNLTDAAFLHVRGFIYYIPGFLSMALMPSCIQSYEDSGFYRLERSTKSYPTSALLVACSAADLVIDQLLPSFYLIIVYFLAGLPPTASVFWPSWMVLVLICWVYRCAANVATLMSKSRKEYQILLMIVVFHMWTFGGIIVPISDLPPWLYWATWPSFVPYAGDALLSLMLSGQSFACDPKSFQASCPVTGEEYAREMSSHGLSTVQNMFALLGLGTTCCLLTYALTICSAFRRRKCFSSVNL